MSGLREDYKEPYNQQTDYIISLALSGLELEAWDVREPATKLATPTRHFEWNGHDDRLLAGTQLA